MRWEGGRCARRPARSQEAAGLLTREVQQGQAQPAAQQPSAQAARDHPRPGRSGLPVPRTSPALCCRGQGSVGRRCPLVSTRSIGATEGQGDQSQKSLPVWVEQTEEPAGCGPSTGLPAALALSWAFPGDLMSLGVTGPPETQETEGEFGVIRQYWVRRAARRGRV